MPNRTRVFKPPSMAFCLYVGREMKIHEYANREHKIAYLDYCLLTDISEIKNNLCIDTSVVPKTIGFNMQKHNDQHKLWAHTLAIYGSSAFAINLRTSRRLFDVPRLSKTPVLNVFAYI